MKPVKSILKNILCCPLCNSGNLHFEDDKVNCTACNNYFLITDNIPVLLPNKENASKKSGLHHKAGTNFEYISHYTIRAEVFDYFEEKTGAVKHNDRRLREYIISKVPKPKGLILDVGSGSAWVAKHFCKLGYQVISFDISVKNTSKALKQYPFSNHAAVAGDVFSLPFKQGCFDYIIASEIIEHVTEPAKFVEKLFGALKPGGQLIVSTPYKEKIEYSLCVHCNKPTPKSAHLHSFDEKKLVSLYNGSNIKNVGYFKFGNKALVYMHTHKILGLFPFGIWKIIDKLASFFYNRPVSIIVKWQKMGS